MFVYHLILLTLLAALLGIALWNLVLIRRPDAEEIDDASLPFVSVLVPARNEERNIRACIDSLLRQDYPAYEVIALDDDSGDRTGVILGELQARDGRLRAIRGAALPAGWTGKNHACHQLAGEAKGEWLLFTDADTVHEQDSLRTAVRTARSRGAGLLTLIPLQVMTTFVERLILPLLHFIALSFFPVHLVEHSRRRGFAVGIGQFMLFRRETYEAAGGHASVRNAIVEDVWLARCVKESGGRVVVGDGTRHVRCRMYQGFVEIWRGFSKNVFAGFDFSLWKMLAAMAVLFVLFVLPYALFIWRLLDPATPRNEILLLGGQILAIYAIRFSISAKFRLGVLSSLLHPAGILLVIAIALNSYRWLVFGGGTRWKDRDYTLRSLTQQSGGS